MKEQECSFSIVGDQNQMGYLSGHGAGYACYKVSNSPHLPSVGQAT